MIEFTKLMIIFESYENFLKYSYLFGKRIVSAVTTMYPIRSNPKLSWYLINA